MSYSFELLETTRRNTEFRKVLFTGKKTQIVAMNIPQGGDIGEEIHEHVEQILVIAEGKAFTHINGTQGSAVSGDVIVVPPGAKHNILNVGEGPLKLYTIYTPPNHIDGRVHHTKADAEADLEDEAFGHQAYEGNF